MIKIIKRIVGPRTTKKIITGALAMCLVLGCAPVKASALFTL